MIMTKKGAKTQRTMQRWDGTFKSRVMEMIQIAKSGGDQITPMRRAANAIEQEFGGIERLVEMWATQVKAITDSDDKGSTRAMNAWKLSSPSRLSM